MVLPFAEVISLSVAPVVIISACGLLCMAFYNRLAFLVARVRHLQRETLALLEKKKEDKKLALLIRKQIKMVLKRAFLLRICVFFLILAIFFEIADCLLLSLSSFYPMLGNLVLTFFVMGLSSILIGLIAAIWEITLALEPIILEVVFIEERLDERNLF